MLLSAVSLVKTFGDLYRFGFWRGHCKSGKVWGKVEKTYIEKMF